MKKLIVAGSLAAGLAALAAYRIRQSKQNKDEEFPVPEDFATYTPPPAPKDEPVGV
jgi:hypothetical protein